MSRISPMSFSQCSVIKSAMLDRGPIEKDSRRSWLQVVIARSGAGEALTANLEFFLSENYRRGLRNTQFHPRKR